MSPLDLTVTEVLDRLGDPAEPMGGSSAAALGAAMGLVLFEKALRAPGPDVSHQRAGEEREVIVMIRRKIIAVMQDDTRVIAALAETRAMPEHPAKPQQVIAARLAAYRSARRLVDLSIQGLSRIKAPLEFGSFEMVGEIEAGWRMLSAGLEAAVAACESHLKPLEQRFAERERAALMKQARQGREMADRAQGALAWRRGHYS